MDIISDTKPKARKDHICDWCGGIIHKGELYHRAFIKYDGVYAWKNHLRCGEIAHKLKMFDYCDEGLTEESFREYIQEEFCELWRKKDEKYFEGENFKIPTFLEQLQFVCEHYLDN